MNNATYWQKRRSQRLVESELLTSEGIVKSIGLYKKALKNINQDINDFYLKYSDKTGLDVSELTEIIKGTDRRKFLIDIQNKMQRLGFDLEEVYNPEYLKQISRLDSLKQQIYWEIASIAPAETDIMGKSYAKMIDYTYRSTFNDYSGITSSMNQLDVPVIKKFLKQRWLGENFSSRIWGNTTKFAKEAPEIVGSGFASGWSQEKIGRELRSVFDVTRREALTLVRTESNYLHNQVSKEATVDAGFERYEYYAVMDSRTSEICQDHDGQVFYYEDAIVGENFPPLHPNCRSTDMPLFDDEEGFDRARPRDVQPQDIDIDTTDLQRSKEVLPNTDFITARKGKDIFYFPKDATANDITKELGKDWSSIWIKNNVGEIKDYSINSKKFGEFDVKQTKYVVGKSGDVTIIKDGPGLSNMFESEFKKKQNEIDINERWKQAMKSQLKPDKPMHDYNAELNLLTREFKGPELVAKMDELISRIPPNDPLKPAIKNVAKISGWEEPKIEGKSIINYSKENTAEIVNKLNEWYVNNPLKNVTDEYLKDIKVKYSTSAEVYGEAFEGKDKLISNIGEEKVYTRKPTELLLSDKASIKTFNHEMGHFVDSYYFKTDKYQRGVKYPDTVPVLIENNYISEKPDSYLDLSSSKHWKPTDVEIEEVVKHRIGSASYKTLSDPVYENWLRYYKHKKEVFADSYSWFLSDQKGLMDKAPNIYNFWMDIFDGKIERNFAE